MHVVSLIGHGIGLLKTQLWELDEVSTEFDEVCENWEELYFLCESGLKETDLCGTVGSPACEHDGILVLALNEMFGNSSIVTTYINVESLY